MEEESFEARPDRAAERDAGEGSGGGLCERPGGRPDRTPVAERTQRLHRFSGAVQALVDELVGGGVNPIGLNAVEAAETVLELVTAADRLAGLAALLTHHAETVDVAALAQEGAATSIRAWLTGTTRVTPGQAARMVRLGSRLATGYAATAAALQAGQVNPEQADVILTALDQLPTWVLAEDRARAEQHLLELAATYDATKLRTLARHLLHVIDPEAADAELAKQLEREEAAAARATMLVLREDGHGICHGRFRIPALHGAMLAKYLDAIANPRRPHHDPESTDPNSADQDSADPNSADQAPEKKSQRNTGKNAEPGGELGSEAASGAEEACRPKPARVEVLGQAFCELLERFPAKKLPQAGGVNATVVVTIPLDTLLTGIGAGTLDTGGSLSVGAVRRLACQAGVIPAVLGTKSEILDAGRKARFHSPVQRTMLAVRDKGCTASGCDRPAAWCHAHHDIPFSQGGPTDVRHGRLLCPRHHTLIHTPGYQATRSDNGQVRITRTIRRQ